MLKNIRISELQFHLRNEKCKVYPVTINELPFYLCLKHDDREIYDEYFEHTKSVCPGDFGGNIQNYEYFVNLFENIKYNGWDGNEGVLLTKNPTGKFGKTNKNHKASDGGCYVANDAMHRCAILFYLYGDVSLKLKALSGRRNAYYKPLIEENET